MAAEVAPEKEAAVIAWLLGRQDVREAVDLASAGYDAMALPALLCIIRHLLSSADGKAASAPPAQAPKRPSEESAEAVARKRPRSERAEQPAAAVAEAEKAEKAEAAEAPPRDEHWLARSERMLAEHINRHLQSREEQEAERRALASELRRDRVPLYWMIDLPEVSKVLQQRGLLPAEFRAVERPHTTLLYLGGETDLSRVARHAGLTLKQCESMCDKLKAMEGQELEVRMHEIVIEEHVACAVVSLPPSVPCANKVPHITLGLRSGVPAKYSNEVLEEVKKGYRDGVTVIQLPVPRPLKGKLMLEWG